MRHAFLVAEAGVGQPATEMGQRMSWFPLNCLAQRCESLLILAGLVVCGAEIVERFDVAGVHGCGFFEGLSRNVKLSRAKACHSTIEIGLVIVRLYARRP